MLLCFSCLSSDRKFIPLIKVKYRQILRDVGIMFNADVDMICWECAAMVRRLHIFTQQALTAQQTLILHKRLNMLTKIQSISPLRKTTITKLDRVIVYDETKDTSEKSSNYTSRNTNRLKPDKDTPLDLPSQPAVSVTPIFSNFDNLPIKLEVDVAMSEHTAGKSDLETTELHNEVILKYEEVYFDDDLYENSGDVSVIGDDGTAIDFKPRVDNQVLCTMSYEKEQSRLLALFEQADVSENEQCSSDDEDEIDHISERSLGSDTEQDCSDDEQETIVSTSNQQFYNGKDNSTQWSSQPPRANVRTGLENIILQKPGVKPFARNDKTEIECWRRFITDDMLEQIVCHTNAEIKQRQLSNNKQSLQYLLKETTVDELLALFGLLYLAGLNRFNGQNLSDLWRTDGTGVEIFSTTMSLHRFYLLQSCLRFDDATTRQERKQLDNLAPIRFIFDEFVSNCKSTYTPNGYLTIDEMLVAFRGRCSFRQYIPNKPAKYGIKFYALVDAKNFYTINLEIYPGNQPNGPFLQRNKAFDVVDRLVLPISRSNRNITFDNWFTSVPLITHLQQNHKLTSTGALRKKEKEIPPNFINTRRKEVYSTQFAFRKDMTLISYVPKRSKVVLVLSSLHHDQNIDPASGEERIPEMITFYDSTKAGVDVVDELCATYDVSRSSKRWPMTVFYAVMNVAAINSVIIFRENNNSKTNRRHFLRKLGLSMLEGHLRVRKYMENLPRGLRKRIHEQVGETITYPPNKSSRTYTRCKDCPTAKDRKTKHNCNKCNKPICMQHIIPVCQSCVDFDSE